MNNIDNQPDDEQIKAFFKADSGIEESILTKARKSAIARTRFNIGQQDTVLFAFVKLWTTLAKMLAPLFAFMAVKHAGRRSNSLHSESKPVSSNHQHNVSDEDPSK